jgi:anti-sigma factor RsiW
VGEAVEAAVDGGSRSEQVVGVDDQAVVAGAAPQDVAARAAVQQVVIAGEDRELVVAFAAEQLAPAAALLCGIRREQNIIPGAAIEDARRRGERSDGGQVIVAVATREMVDRPPPP